MAAYRKCWIVRVISKYDGGELAKYVYDNREQAREAYESVRHIRIKQNRENVKVTLRVGNDPTY